jgi:hypothetical protein
VDRALAVLGVNVVAVSVLAAVYGLYTQDTAILGVALSVSLVGAVLLAMSFASSGAVLSSLVEYAEIASRALTTVVEDLDLLRSRLLATVDGGEVRLAIARTPDPGSLGTGIGVRYGEPYISFPVGRVLEGATVVTELDGRSLESALGSVLVDSLGLCSRVVTEVSGRFVRVELYGISRPLERMCGMPVNPVNVLTAVALARVTGRAVALVESGQVAGGRYVVFEVVS